MVERPGSPSQSQPAGSPARATASLETIDESAFAAVIFHESFKMHVVMIMYVPAVSVCLQYLDGGCGAARGSGLLFSFAGAVGLGLRVYLHRMSDQERAQQRGLQLYLCALYGLTFLTLASLFVRQQQPECSADDLFSHSLHFWHFAVLPLMMMMGLVNGTFVSSTGFVAVAAWLVMTITAYAVSLWHFEEVRTPATPPELSQTWSALNRSRACGSRGDSHLPWALVRVQWAPPSP